MLHNEEKIKKLLKKSKEIITDCALENGAIVAANSDKDYYPHQARDYHYVWPRDAAYICVAAQMVGITNIQEPFFQWLVDRPEDFKKEEKLFANYSANGRIRIKNFQPDQAGAVLWAMHEFYKEDFKKSEKFEGLIRRLSDGMRDDWREEYFFSNTVDLWEEGHRKTSTKFKNNHTYSLAACARGLLYSDIMLPNKSCRDCAAQMIKKIDEAYIEKHKAFVRNHGIVDDLNMDSSLLGLVWPFNIIEATDKRMVNTVQKMEDLVVTNGGVHRYQFDYYDGEGTAQEGGGAWPILNFWMSIYWAIKDNRQKALEYYMWVVERVEDDLLIPEQLFEDSRKGIKPLTWSHAMFIVASKFLGFLK